MESTSLTPDENTQQDPLLDAKHFYQHDPLFLLLKVRWHLHDGWILLSGTILPAIAYAPWIVWLTLAPPSRNHYWTLNNTISVCLLVTLVFPSLFLIYLHLPTWLANLFNQFHTHQIIGPQRVNLPGPKTYPDAVRLLTVWIDKWWWTAGALAVMTLYIIYRPLVIEMHNQSFMPLWLKLLAFTAFAPLIYATILCIIRIIIIFVATNWLIWAFTIRINPMHPDGSGGLGMLTKLMWLCVVMLLWDALLLYTGWALDNISVFTSAELYLLGTVYIALVPLILFGWTLLPHFAMVRARDSYLQPLSDEFYQLFTQNILSTHEDTTTMKAATDRLHELERRITFVRTTFPTWPIALMTLGRLLGTLILPPLIALLLPRWLPW